MGARASSLLLCKLIWIFKKAIKSARKRCLNAQISNSSWPTLQNGKTKMSRLLSTGLLLLVLSLTGCVSQMNNTMKSWEGSHFSSLIESWGPPNQVLDDGQDGKIFCYQSTGSFSTPGSSTTTGNAYSFGNTANYYGTTAYNPPQTYSYQRYRMFWVNSAGYIYKWSWRGY